MCVARLVSARADLTITMIQSTYFDAKKIKIDHIVMSDECVTRPETISGLLESVVDCDNIYDVCAFHLPLFSLSLLALSALLLRSDQSRKLRVEMQKALRTAQSLDLYKRFEVTLDKMDEGRSDEAVLCKLVVNIEEKSRLSAGIGGSTGSESTFNANAAIKNILGKLDTLSANFSISTQRSTDFSVSCMACTSPFRSLYPPLCGAVLSER